MWCVLYANWKPFCTSFSLLILVLLFSGGIHCCRIFLFFRRVVLTRRIKPESAALSWLLNWFRHWSSQNFLSLLPRNCLPHAPQDLGLFSVCIGQSNQGCGWNQVMITGYIRVFSPIIGYDPHNTNGLIIFVQICGLVMYRPISINFIFLSWFRKTTPI